MAPEDPLHSGRITGFEPLVSPRQAREEVPLPPELGAVVVAGQRAVASVLDGKDDRLLVVVGPCSIHDPAAALEYARLLRETAERLDDRLLIVMRVYLEKPRSTLGWKGLLQDPGLDGSHLLNEGVRISRSILVKVVTLGLPVGCEFLDPILVHYLADFVSWAAIGARTAQSQIHRQLASGLSMPVGFKNSTEGGVKGALDAVVSASSPHVFPGITLDGLAAIVSTTGNPDCHLVLRGGESGPNYDEENVDRILGDLGSLGLPRRVVIDASHDNSKSHANGNKDHRRQADVIADVAKRLAKGSSGIAGVMMESFLVPGRQVLTPGITTNLAYGQSVTDACIGWEETETLLQLLAGAVDERRAHRHFT